MPEAEVVLRSAYKAFNARDVEAAIELMHPDADWPNAWEGGRVVGRGAVRDYWNRQFAAISSKVEPERYTEGADGSITVEVRQVVHDARTGALISDSHVLHRYWLVDGFVVRMDVVDQIGSEYGWSKVYAPGEWWHVDYVGSLPSRQPTWDGAVVQADRNHEDPTLRHLLSAIEDDPEFLLNVPCLPYGRPG
jgi:ketosteroid isomerase-like protein